MRNVKAYVARMTGSAGTSSPSAEDVVWHFGAPIAEEGNLKRVGAVRTFNGAKARFFLDDEKVADSIIVQVEKHWVRLSRPDPDQSYEADCYLPRAGAAVSVAVTHTAATISVHGRLRHYRMVCEWKNLEVTFPGLPEPCAEISTPPTSPQEYTFRYQMGCCPGLRQREGVRVLAEAPFPIVGAVGILVTTKEDGVPGCPWQTVVFFQGDSYIPLGPKIKETYRGGGSGVYHEISQEPVFVRAICIADVPGYRRHAIRLQVNICGDDVSVDEPEMTPELCARLGIPAERKGTIDLPMPKK